MSDAPRELPVLCFFTGSLSAGIAARGVRVLATQPEHPHLAEFLGVESNKGGDNERTIEVAHAGSRVYFRVDGPVRIENIKAAQIVPSPTSMQGSPSVMGYAQHYRQLIALLDIPRLVKMAKQDTDWAKKEDA